MMNICPAGMVGQTRHSLAHSNFIRQLYQKASHTTGCQTAASHAGVIATTVVCDEPAGWQQHCLQIRQQLFISTQIQNHRC
jgi:hypothetical protein